MDTLQVALGMVGPVLVLVGTLLGSWWTRRTGEEKNKTADWDALLQRMESWTARELAAQAARIELLEKEVEEIRRERDDYRHERDEHRQGRDEMRRKYNAALTYLGWLCERLREFVDPADWREPPRLIADDLV